MLIDILSFSCPLLLCSFAALFSEYAGSLALFLEGLVSFSAFVFFTLCVKLGGTMPVVFAAFVITIILMALTVFLFILLIQKFKAHKFIAGTAMNLLFTALTSAFSSMIFKTRGVLTSPLFSFDVTSVKIFTILITVLITALSIVFLAKTRTGLYLRITGSDSNVLIAKGVDPSWIRILSWTMAGAFAALSGILLTLRISSFVPNISSGRGWMALAAVFLGNKKPVRLLIAVIIFCATDYFGVHIQNLFPSIPTAVLLSLPYIVALGMVACSPAKKS